MEITESEVINAILAAQRSTEADDPPGAITTDELYETLQIGKFRLRKVIKKLLDDGELELVRVYRQRIDGVSQPIPAWRIKRGEQ